MNPMVQRMNRRGLIAGLAGLGVMAIIGCSRSPKTAQTQNDTTPAIAASARSAPMTVYRDPSCGCCEAWAGIAKQAGYQVSLIDRPDMPAIKAKLGVPEALVSCHTATVADFTLEGHVPMAYVARLLEEKPRGVRGLAVAGMPRGSPGMEMPDGSKDAYQVMAFDADGNANVFKI